MKELNVGFIGNPNCGKTTLFNAYTGANLKVANWPGVTVEKVEGAIKSHNMNIKLVDLPGTYSLTSYTLEEQVARNYILSDEVSVIVDVLDASSLERNLYLALMLLELEKPIVIALNMMDVVEKRGMEIDLHRLPEMLGVPVIPVSARSRKGINSLMHAVVHHAESSQDKLIHNHAIDKNMEEKHNKYAMVYSEKIENKIDLISERLKEEYPELDRLRYYAIKHLEMDTEILEKYPLSINDLVDRSYESEIINEKYDFIEEIISEVVFNKDKKEELTEKIDKVLTGKYTGIPVFLGIMALVFFLTFSVGDFLKSYFEIIIEDLSFGINSFLNYIKVSDFLVSLVTDGIVAGVGGILTFLPNIFILFLALSFLEDSGYMARVAYVMDGIMGKLGLSGRSFIPMILGFGCTVPAIMASRALENEKDRKRVILVTPFMSCSARLPIYILFSGMFFGKYRMITAYSMYLIGIVVALLTLLFLHIKDGKSEESNLLIELPDYKMPGLRTVWIYVSEKVKDYILKAGTTIFIASVILWFILNFGFNGYTKIMSDSFGADIGHILVPLLAPIGLGFWQIGVALIAGISAKEVVVSAVAVLFGISNINGETGILELREYLFGIGFGPENAYVLMIFSLLYIPCAATLGVIKKEAGLKYMLFVSLFQIGIAYILSLLIFNGFRIFM